MIDKPASTSAETRATGPNRFTAPVGTNLPDLAVEARERASHHRIVFELTASINAAEFFEKENELEVVAFLRQRFPSLVRINGKYFRFAFQEQITDERSFGYSVATFHSIKIGCHTKYDGHASPRFGRSLAKCR